MTDARHTVGGNQPPSQIDFAAETGAVLSAFLKDEPVIQTEETARAGKLLVDRAASCIKDMEAERDGLVRPINEQVKQINDRYRGPRTDLQQICGILTQRLEDYARAEEEKRIAAAEQARLAVEEAARKAREAEAIEHGALSDVAHGTVGVDAVAASKAADEAFAAFQKAERDAARAEKETKVKIGGGFNRSLSLRTHEILAVENAVAAITAMGVTDKIRDGILSSARDYRKVFDELPDGIIATQERSL